MELPKLLHPPEPSSGEVSPELTSSKTSLKKLISFDDSFHLEKPLTQSGKIYLAKRITKGQTLVIKFIPTHEPSYTTEIQALILLKDCRHVVQMYQEDLSSPGYHLLAMEYMEKGDLVDYFRQNPRRRNDPVIMKSILYQILVAISEVHKNNIVHRDIKMDNFLVTLTHHHNLTNNLGVTSPGGGSRSPLLKLADFGLAAILPASTSSSTTTSSSEITSPYPDLMTRCGTFSYAMPESCYTKKIYKHPFSIDIYAAGVTIYYILTGDNSANTPFGFLPKWNTYRLDENIATENLISMVRKMTFLSLEKRPTIKQIIESLEEKEGPLENILNFN